MLNVALRLSLHADAQRGSIRLLRWRMRSQRVLPRSGYDVLTKGLTEQLPSMPLCRLPVDFRYSGGWDLDTFRLASVAITVQTCRTPQYAERSEQPAAGDSARWEANFNQSFALCSCCFCCSGMISLLPS